MRDMESLIHHFIIFTQGFKPPKGETYCGPEAVSYTHLTLPTLYPV